MGIKGLLGFCECKGCKKRMKFEMDTILHLPDGSKKTETMRICGDHAIEIAQKGKIMSVTVEHTMGLQSDK